MAEDTEFDIDKVLSNVSDENKSDKKMKKKSGVFDFLKKNKKENYDVENNKKENDLEEKDKKENYDVENNKKENDLEEKDNAKNNLEEKDKEKNYDVENNKKVKDLEENKKSVSSSLFPKSNISEKSDGFKKDISKIEEMLSSKDKVREEIKKETEKFDDLQAILSKENKIAVELKKQIGKCDDGQVLIKCDSSNNHDVFIAIIKCILEHGKKPVVILSSMNYKTAKKLIEKANIETEKIVLIDTITKNILDVEEEKGVVFVDSLRDLTQLQIKLIKFIEKENDLVFVFDSVNVLELYHKETIVFKFIYSLTKLLHKNKINGYYILGKKSLAPKISQFFDNLVELKKFE
jgi:hypothetical protein